jgi:serine/threonine protein kinase
MADDLTPVMGPDDRRRSERLSLENRRPPAVVPGYELERSLGEGAFGEVWVAVNRNTRMRVAIKFYSHRGGMDWSLLSREVEKLRFLRADRYVVQLLEVGWNATPPFYVMEYMERGALEDQLEQRQPAVAEAVAMTREVAVGLVHAHARGILHCDLKPANILLDQDGKPRLADFGQARLTHDQNPALGTLFYMAPEQADLKAAPDARWDVYALGAILYRMLTGELPYRTPEAVAHIQEADRLEDRLRRYRHFIQQAPRPTAHRKVPGVDSRLAEVVERCLAVKPEKRFANPQSVLHALDSRALHRARRPLLLFGIIGPALLVVVVALFAWRGLNTAVTESDHTLSHKALSSNRFAARFVAASVARKMMQRWNILSEEAQKPAFQKLVQQAAGKDKDSTERRALQEWLDERRQEYVQTSAARAWFLLDNRGTLLAVSPLNDVSRRSLGKDLSYRSYFHGGDHDYTPGESKQQHPKPITQPTQSAVFESKTEDQPLMVVFSVPVVAPDSPPAGPLAVLAMGVRLGAFKEMRPGESENAAEEQTGVRTAVLISTKKDWEGRPGLILQHPWLEHFSREQKPAPKVHVPEEVVKRLIDLRELTMRREQTRGGRGPQYLLADEEEARKDALMDDYVDPVCALSKDSGYPWHADSAGTWLAAAEPVIIPPARDGSKFLDTGWVVLVEERTEDALAPVRKLGGELVVQGVETLCMLLVILGGLWAFVLVVLNDSSRSRLMAFLRRRAGLSSVGGAGGTVTPSGGKSLPRSGVSGAAAGRETAPTVPFPPPESR